MKTKISSLKTPQSIEVINHFKNALNGVNPTDKQVQFLLEHAIKFENELSEIIKKFTTTDEFVFLQKQIKEHCEIWNLDPTESLKFAKDIFYLPKGAEEYITFPSPIALAKKYFPNEADPNKLHYLITKLVYDKMIERCYKNGHYSTQDITPENLKIKPYTRYALEQICKKQSGDILIIPIRCDWENKWLTANNLKASFEKNEFGLPIYIVISSSLVYPHTLYPTECITIYCLGDKFFIEKGQEDWRNIFIYRIYERGSAEIECEFRKKTSDEKRNKLYAKRNWNYSTCNYSYFGILS